MDEQQRTAILGAAAQLGILLLSNFDKTERENVKFHLRMLKEAFPDIFEKLLENLTPSN